MPQVHARRVSGNLAYWSTHQKRILDGIGEGVVKYITDLLHFPVDDTTGDPTEYTTNSCRSRNRSYYNSTLMLVVDKC